MISYLRKNQGRLMLSEIGKGKLQLSSLSFWITAAWMPRACCQVISNLDHLVVIAE